MEKCMEIPYKTKNRATIWSSVPTHGHISGETTIQEDTCSPVFTATLFTIAKTWKHSKSTNSWVDKDLTHYIYVLYIYIYTHTHIHINLPINIFIDYVKPLTVWITINCGKFWKRWEYHTPWPASWEICMQVRKPQLELDMEQQNGSK